MACTIASRPLNAIVAEPLRHIIAVVIPQVQGINVAPLNVEVLGMNRMRKKVKQYILSN
jgi:hypothetical protein